MNTSRLDGQTDFTKRQVDAQRIQDLDWLSENLKLYLAVTGLASFGDPLLSLEQFGVGGSEFGHGYDPLEIAVHTIKDYPMPTQHHGWARCGTSSPAPWPRPASVLTCKWPRPCSSAVQPRESTPPQGLMSAGRKRSASITRDIAGDT